MTPFEYETILGMSRGDSVHFSKARLQDLMQKFPDKEALGDSNGEQ